MWIIAVESLCVSLQLKVPDYLSLFTNFKINFVDKILWFLIPFKWNLLGSSFTKYQGRDLASPPPTHLLFLDQTEIQKAEKKNFFYTEPPLSQGLDDCSPPPSYLNDWICHWVLYVHE